MAYRFIAVERDGHITVVTINRPEAYNALHAAAHVELQRAFDDFEADDEQWVAILTGAGPRAFCAGHDLKTPPPREIGDLPPGGFGGLTTRFGMTKPVIAAVNGFTMGGGFEIALSCDIIIATAGASFALPEVKVGVAALAGGIIRLTQQIGLKRAMGLILTGRKVSAAEGQMLGFVNEVVDGDVLPAAMRWAGEIAANSPMAVRATKETALRSLSEPFETAMASQWNYPAVLMMQQSGDAAEGFAAFAEKRAPLWPGK